MRHLSRTAVALAVGSAISMSAQAEIIISEYIEGGSYNKAIEIANTGAEAASLDGYALKTKASGLGEWSKDHDLSGITIQPNDVYVLIHSSANDAIKSVSDTEASVINHNGDETYMLFKDGQPHDNIGVDGDVDWGKDKTLVRRVYTPSAAYVAEQWESFPKDNSDDLGKIGEGSGEVTPPPAFECKTEDGSEPAFTNINEIQGAGDKSPLIESGYITESEYFVRGVVTARGESLFKGFYLQALDADGLDTTSDGLFIHTGDAPSDDIQPGVEVCVKGKVQELFNLTQLDSDNNSYVVTATDGAVPTPQPLVINEGETLRDALERYEGMMVELDAESDLRITRSFSYDYDSRRNNMVLSNKVPNVKPTQLYAAESEKAVAEQEKNTSNRIVVESDYKAQSGEVPYFADFNPEDGYIRIGDRVENLEGVISYSYGEYRLVATNQLGKSDFVRDDAVAHERTDAPALAEESGIKVASFNVLNFFTSFSEIGGPLNASCSDQDDADASRGCNRGSKDAEEFPLQRAKIVNAMKAMDADIIGVMEMENNGFGDGSAIKNLVDALNAEFSDPADFYTYVEISDADGQKYAKEGADFEGQKYFGTDAIMVGMFYRPASVSLAGDAQVIVTPEQHNSDFDKYQRHSLLQGFNVPGQEEPLHVVVNHFKSKGSGCIEDVDATDDLQGNCTEFRVSAAEVVGQAVSQLNGDVLVIGDLNSYGMEDPVLALTTIPAEREGKVKTAAATTLDGKEHDAESRVLAKGAGLVNLSELDAFSYTYEGELGSLDHVLGNTSVAGKRLGITDWHINSLESNMFEYGSSYTGDLAKSENPFSASDHDPVIVTLNYKGIAEGVKVKPVRDGGSATLPVAVSSDDAGKYIVVTLDVAPAAKLVSFSAEASEQTDTTKVTHQVTQAEANSGSADIALPAELASGNYQAKLALYEGYPNAAYEQTPVDLGTATITVEKAASSSTPEPTPTPKPTTAPAEGGSSGGSFGFGALLALAGLGWTRRRRT